VKGMQSSDPGNVLCTDATAVATRKGYLSSNKRFGKYLAAHGHADKVDAAGYPIVPAAENLILDFLGHASLQRGKKDKQPSFSAINNYASAIKFCHREAGHPLPEGSKDKISTFLTGGSLGAVSHWW
jgi:hypothetical protein